MLLTDTNILQRVCLGKAMRHVDRLDRRGIRLATTVHNAFELRRKLVTYGLTDEQADGRVRDTLRPFELIDVDEYQHLQGAADARLSEGGKPDWPLLAAALALHGQIWSEDKDFFGTGVPVWSTANIRFIEQDDHG